jgi:hypothetical protein
MSLLDPPALTRAQGDARYGKAGRKSPPPTLGDAAISLADVTSLTGTATATLATGPNGKPAIKIVTGVGLSAEVRFNRLLGGTFYGDAHLCFHGSRTQGNLQYATFYVSQDDGAFTNGVSYTLQYDYSAPLNSFREQGGANTYYFGKGGFSNIGSPTYPMTIGDAKIRINPQPATSATVYIYAVGVSAPAPKGRICVIWDDGYDSMFQGGFPAFQSRGIPQTVAVIGSVQDTGSGYSYLAQLQAFVDSGNAVVAHGPWPNSGTGNLFSAYPGSSNPVGDAVADMERNRDYLNSKGLLVPNADKCYIWPQGQFQQSVNDTTLLDAAYAAGFTTARGTTPFLGGVNFDSLSKYNKMVLPILGHTWSGSTAAEVTNISNITTAISGLSTSRSDSCLMLHRALKTATNDAGMGSAGNITIRNGDLETIAAQIKSGIDAGTLEAVTLPQLASSTWWQQF